MKEAIRGVRITTEVLALTATLISCELGFETCETPRFGFDKTACIPKVARVCTPIEIEGIETTTTYDYLGAKRAFPLCPIVVHSYFFPFYWFGRNLLGKSLTLAIAKGQSLILCSTHWHL